MVKVCEFVWVGGFAQSEDPGLADTVMVYDPAVVGVPEDAGGFPMSPDSVLKVNPGGREPSMYSMSALQPSRGVQVVVNRNSYAES